MNTIVLKIEYLQINKCSECDLMRHAVRWMNDRDEHLNQDKSIDLLIREFLIFWKQFN